MAGAAKLDDDDGINDINVTPLVDVMLVLLVIFLVASVYIVKEAVEIELPKVAIVDYEPPKPKPRSEDTPPPPKPLPPKPKPKETAPAEKSATPPPPSQQPQNPGEPDIGLDSTSFGTGSGGAAFHAGTSQMGNPTGRGGGGGGQPVEVNKPAPKLVEARPRAGNKQPAYSDSARRMAIEGTVVIEADVDERGKVTRAVVRNKLEPELDEETRKVVLAWAFDPAMLQGKAVPSTKFLRFRFQLQ